MGLALADMVEASSSFSQKPALWPPDTKNQAVQKDTPCCPSSPQLSPGHVHHDCGVQPVMSQLETAGVPGTGHTWLIQTRAPQQHCHLPKPVHLHTIQVTNTFTVCKMQTEMPLASLNWRREQQIGFWFTLENYYDWANFFFLHIHIFYIKRKWEKIIGSYYE